MKFKLIKNKNITPAIPISSASIHMLTIVDAFQFLDIFEICRVQSFAII